MKKNNPYGLCSKIICVALAVVMSLPLSLMGVVPATAEENVQTTYVKDGLVAWYDGVNNTKDGHDDVSLVWEDLIGGHDLPVTKDANNYFNETGFYTTQTQHYFPQAIVDVINDQSFSVEILFGEFISIGSDFNTFLNSSNDNFALFRRNSNNVLEFKFAANPSNERPTVSDGLDIIDGSTITITYLVGGECRIYVDGVLCAEVACPKTMGADDLFIGHESPSKHFKTTYRSMRFYDRELTAAEVKANAQVDGTFDENAPSIQETYIEVAQPVTHIVGDVAITREINSAAELSEMMSSEALPAAAIYTFDRNMNILDKESNTIASLAEILGATQYKVLPILVPVDRAEATIDALAEFVKDTRFSDICIMSQDAALVNAARTKAPSIRGAVDFTEKYATVKELTKEQCLDIRHEVKSHAASVAVLPANVCRQDTVQYLFDGQINVWARAEDAPSITQKYFALLSGAVGVISDDTQGLLDIACNQLEENTMTRVPLNVGHRGIPSLAPENTIEGSLYAYETGATCIELDIYLTKDGKIVVMHDGTTGRTCNQDLPVEASTWEQLSQLYVNKGYENNETYKNCRIPLLEDYLKAFKGKECRLFIEIKSSNSAIVPAMKALIDQYDMYGQCSVITFNTGIMTAMRQKYPEMSLGALCSGYLDEVDSNADMKAVMAFIGATNATLNPSHSGYGSKAVRAALIRGIGVFPWTFRGNANTYLNYFIWGYAGLTGDNANVLNRFVKDWQVTGTVPTLGKDETAKLAMSLTYFGDKEVANDGEIEVIEGNTAALNGHTLTGLGSGSVALIAKYAYRLSSERVTVYSQPIVVEMTGDDIPADTTNSTDVSNPTDTMPTDTQDELADTLTESETEAVQVTTSVSGDGTEGSTTDTGCGSLLSGSLLILCGLASLTSAVVKKKED